MRSLRIKETVSTIEPGSMKVLLEADVLNNCIHAINEEMALNRRRGLDDAAPPACEANLPNSISIH
jgi:hypothetical protein